MEIRIACYAEPSAKRRSRALRARFARNDIRRYQEVSFEPLVAELPWIASFRRP